MRKVIFATPSYDGKVHVEYMFSLINTINLAAQKGIAIIPVCITKDALVERARNNFVKMAIESNCDDIVFMDSDQEWNPADVIQLLEHNVDVIGCPVVKKSDTNVDFNICKIEGEEIDENGLLVVKSVGTGFLRISRNAFEKVWNASTSYQENGTEYRLIFNSSVFNGELYSEDSVFCKKWSDLGGKIYVDTNMNCFHIGEKKFFLNFKEFFVANHSKKALKKEQ